MTERDILLQLQGLDAAQLREVIAVAAGIHAYRDQDGGELVANILQRIADRLRNKPRRIA